MFMTALVACHRRRLFPSLLPPIGRQFPFTFTRRPPGCLSPSFRRKASLRYASDIWRVFLWARKVKMLI